MKTLVKIFPLMLLFIGFALMPSVSISQDMNCDPDVPFFTTLPHPDPAAAGYEGKVTYKYPWRINYYRHLHCGLNPYMPVDPCNPWKLEFYCKASEQGLGGDSVKLLPPVLSWDQYYCDSVLIDFIYPVGYAYGQFSDSIIFKVTIVPHAIVNCTGVLPYTCLMPPNQTIYRDCWVDCWDDLLTMEAQDGCTPANSAICRIEWDKPLPVELTAFNATVKDNNVNLNWKTVSEQNNARFIIQRMKDDIWKDIGTVAGNGTTSNVNNYSYTDRNMNSGVYNYRLAQVDYNGNIEYFNLSNPVSVGVPDKYTLTQNYPNPFNPSTTIMYGIPNDGKVTMKIYDISGREVKVLVNEPKTAGFYTVDFNAGGLSSGVYFYKLESGNFTATKKMVVMK